MIDARFPGASRTLAVIEIGGTSVKFGFANNGEPLSFSTTVPTARIRTEDAVKALAHLARSVGAEADLDVSTWVVTVPGFIARDRDTVVHAANVPELNGRRLATDLSSALDADVVLERDVVLQLLGECRAGSVKGEDHVLAIYLGTGIGAAYVGDGQVFRGGGWALELGHMPVHGLGRTLPGLQPDRLEVYASGRTLSALAARHEVQVAGLFTAATHRPALQVDLDAVVRDQAFAIASAMAMMSPQVVLLGGGIVTMDDYPRDRLAAIVAEHRPVPAAIQPLDLRWSTLGWKAAVWGAIELADARGRRPIATRRGSHAQDE